MAHLGARAFGAISGEVVQTTAFVLGNRYEAGNKPIVHRLVEGKEKEKEAAMRAGRNRFATLSQDDFVLIPGSPVVYWASEGIRRLFRDGRPLGELVEAKHGLKTGNNDLFLRRWWEVDIGRIGFGMQDRAEALQSGRKWFPCNKGGSFRKWYGNHEYVVNWESDGAAIRRYGTEDGGRPRSGASNTQYYFQPAVTWAKVASGPSSFRLGFGGDIFETAGNCAFHEDLSYLLLLTSYCNTTILPAICKLISSTVNFQPGEFNKIPISSFASGILKTEGQQTTHELVEATRADWDAYERSWEFRTLSFLPNPLGAGTIEESYLHWRMACQQQALRCQHLEQENNKLVIQACELEDELSPDVPLSQITLTGNPAYRYSKIKSQKERQQRMLRDDMAALVSYAVGCMMGRYSLDEPGLVYAGSEGKGFDPDKYVTFTADEDAIVPITEDQSFLDDAALRLETFLATVWGKEHLEANLRFLARVLSKGPTTREALQRYLARDFYKDHLKSYQRRPLYWLFTSGRRRTFQCLIYVHRYHDITLARMRVRYVHPLQERLKSKLAQKKLDMADADTPARRRRLEKECQQLTGDVEELMEFDEQLRLYVYERIRLDLDDGVKVNYGKFGSLLKDVKDVTGKPPVILAEID